ncbi:PilW family protein [Herminiimonas sp. NPDC097707]|uniref:PilW family protein n=1 Tax=Herminiimonas sp. NPDC097707 TaxID=3364007 RepID=UPI00383A2DB6
MRRIHHARRFSSGNGFGLVEIMVGLAIGMIATLVIVQVAAMFEGQKRSTTGTADAQTAGSIAIYTMQRQIQMAGYGLPVFSAQNQALNCADKPLADNDGDPDTPEVGVSITPVEIVNGAGGASDQIIVRKGTTAFGGVPLRFPSAPDQNNMLSCQVDDKVLVTNGTKCAMTTVAAVDAAGITFSPVITDPASGTFACLGKRWEATTYEVSGSNLLEGGAQIAGGVVNMQARYGITLAGNVNQITPDAYVDAVDPEWGAAMSASNRNRIKAIRVALVIRNSVKEKEDVTAACSSLTTAAPTGLCAWAGTVANPAPAIDLSADPDWRKYRYRVFDTLIPIRNMIWSADKL